jgi:acetolactate synthase-1/2/3 large subunit
MLGNNFQNALSVAGDARRVMEDPLTLVKGKTKRHELSGWVESLKRLRAEFWSKAEEYFASDDVPLRPQRIIAAINRRLTSGVRFSGCRHTAGSRPSAPGLSWLKISENASDR